jgi:hypothetical protein
MHYYQGQVLAASTKASKQFYRSFERQGALSFLKTRPTADLRIWFYLECLRGMLREKVYY